MEPVNIEEDIMDETKALDHCIEDFSNTIRIRGESYYNNGNIISCKKAKEEVFAKVRGNNNNIYTVSIDLSDNDVVYECSCPCEFPCKHVYSVLVSLKNKDYDKIVLKPKIYETSISLEDLIESIPADEFKKYFLEKDEKIQNGYILNSIDFRNYFRNYLPKQSYEYYYNNLYNNIILQDNEKILGSYLNEIKQYISISDFNEAFKVLKSIIEVYKDINVINDNKLVEQIAIFGMYLRVIYRKSSFEIKNDINYWIKELENNNYYDNYYLEDIILNLKNTQ